MVVIMADKTIQNLHGSRNALAIGTVLLPQGSDLDGLDDDIEEILEAARPASCPRRGHVVYMARNLRTLENVARNSEFIYEVEPIGEIIRLDGAWVNRIWELFADNEGNQNKIVMDRARQYAEGYWSGRPCPKYQPFEETIWEYMASSARVIRDVTNEIKHDLYMEF